MPQFEIYWDEYIKRLRKRVESGALAYGDKSFDLPVSKLIDEIQQEVEDIAGWSLVLWGRLEKMKRAIGLDRGQPLIPCGICEYEGAAQPSSSTPHDSPEIDAPNDCHLCTQCRKYYVCFSKHPIPSEDYCFMKCSQHLGLEVLPWS